MATRFIHPEGVFATPAYTQVVTAKGGKTVYVSGQVALGESGNLVGRGDLRAQTKQVFVNLERCLAAAGATFEDVIKMTTYVVDYRPEVLETIRAVRSEYLSEENPPASTLVGVQALAFEGLLIEVEAIAVV